MKRSDLLIYMLGTLNFIIFSISLMSDNMLSCVLSSLALLSCLVYLSVK